MIIHFPQNSLEYTFAPSSPNIHCVRVYCESLYLQSVLEQLVHLGHLARDGQVDGAVANLDNEAALDLGVDLGNDLELLALLDVGGLVDGGFEAAEGSAVEGLIFISTLFLFASCLISRRNSR
jgi:hypothetical protein